MTDSMAVLFNRFSTVRDEPFVSFGLQAGPPQVNGGACVDPYLAERLRLRPQPWGGSGLAS
jgi:hypothetical protein